MAGRGLSFNYCVVVTRLVEGQAPTRTRGSFLLDDIRVLLESAPSELTVTAAAVRALQEISHDALSQQSEAAIADFFLAILQEWIHRITHTNTSDEVDVSPPTPVTTRENADEPTGI